MHLPEKGNRPVRIMADALKQRFASMVQKKKSGLEKARKRLDAPRFAPDASIPVTLYGGDTQI